MNFSISNKGQVKWLDGHPTNQYTYKSPLSLHQRAILSVTVILLVALSIVGNGATLYVAIKRRKIRTFFRTCLISMACSDLISSIFTGINYLANLFSTFINFWYLGPVLCRMLPFLMTTAILVNGVTLVGIAFDRYLAVKKTFNTACEPSGKQCLLLAAIVWSLSAAVAAPSIPAYKFSDVFVFEIDNKNRTNVLAITPGHMCSTNRQSFGIYYTILFAFLFTPMFVAFVWFNAVLAKEIWSRRKQANSFTNVSASKESHSGKLSGTSRSKLEHQATNSASKSANDKDQNTDGERSQAIPKQTRMSRESRQLKLFFLVLLLMFTYLTSRLPDWIFLILSFYNAYLPSRVNAILLEFSFGILSLSSTVLNPLLYAFVMETVDYIIDVYQTVKHVCIQICICLSSVIEQPSNIDLEQNDIENKPRVALE